MLLLRQQKPFKLMTTIKILSLFTQKQPQKYQRINFSIDGMDLSTFDDSLSIFIGLKIRKQLFSAYICEKNTKLLIPLHKLSKILALPNEIDDSMTVTYEIPSDQLKFRIYSSKANQKTNVTLQLPKQFGQMVSQKYEQPTNPLQHLNELLISTSVNIIPQYATFNMPTMEFIRICKQFGQVSDQVNIRFQSQIGSNKKYIIFSAPTLNGIKTISLSEEKTQEQIQIFINWQNSEEQSKLTISGIFNTGLLQRIATVAALDTEVFQENLRIFLERDKAISMLYSLRGGLGELCCMLSPIII